MRFMRILTAINRFLLKLRAPGHNPRHRDRPPRGRPLSEKREEPRQGAMGLASPVFPLSGGAPRPGCCLPGALAFLVSIHGSKSQFEGLDFEWMQIELQCAALRL